MGANHMSMPLYFERMMAPSRTKGSLIHCPVIPTIRASMYEFSGVRMNPKAMTKKSGKRGIRIQQSRI